MNKKIRLLLLLNCSIFVSAREDCVGNSYRDEYGTYRDNYGLILDGYNTCLCSCTSERTKSGKCLLCQHMHDYSKAKKFSFLKTIKTVKKS